MNCLPCLIARLLLERTIMNKLGGQIYYPQNEKDIKSKLLQQEEQDRLNKEQQYAAKEISK